METPIVETPIIEISIVETPIVETPKEVLIIESKKKVIIEIPKEVLIVDPLIKDERYNLPSTVKHEDENKKKKELTDKITLNMFLSGLKIDEIAKNRGIKENTIVEHIIKNIDHPQITWNKFMNESEYIQIKKAFELMGINVSLKQIKSYVSKDINNDKISIVKELMIKKKY